MIKFSEQLQAEIGIYIPISKKVSLEDLLDYIQVVLRRNKSAAKVELEEKEIPSFLNIKVHQDFSIMIKIPAYIEWQPFMVELDNKVFTEPKLTYENITGPEFYLPGFTDQMDCVIKDIYKPKTLILPKKIVKLPIPGWVFCVKCGNGKNLESIYAFEAEKEAFIRGLER